MHQFCSPRVFKRVCPTRSIRRIQPYPQDWQKSVAIPRHEIADPSLRIDLNNFSPIQAAHVKKLLPLVVGQSLGNQIFSSVTNASRACVTMGKSRWTCSTRSSNSFLPFQPKKAGSPDGSKPSFIARLFLSSS